MNILVTGSRDWTDGRRIVQRLMEEPDGTAIIQGGARGADRLAWHAANALRFRTITAEAEWSVYGKSAGAIRNRKMLDLKPDKVIAFCKNQSRGTMDCVREALSRGIPTEVIDAEQSMDVTVSTYHGAGR